VLPLPSVRNLRSGSRSRNEQNSKNDSTTAQHASKRRKFSSTSQDGSARGGMASAAGAEKKHSLDDDDGPVLGFTAMREPADGGSGEAGGVDDGPGCVRWLSSVFSLGPRQEVFSLNPRFAALILLEWWGGRVGGVCCVPLKCGSPARATVASFCLHIWQTPVVRWMIDRGVCSLSGRCWYTSASRALLRAACNSPLHSPALVPARNCNQRCVIPAAGWKERNP